MRRDRGFRLAVGGLAVLLLSCEPGGTGDTQLDCTDADADLYCAEGDCDDNDATRHPGAEEVIGDGIDSDCDDRELCYTDVDADGYRTDVTVESRNEDCADIGEATAEAQSGDCNDEDFLVFPGAEETVGDSIDLDCDGTELCFVDNDGDGFHADVSVVSDDLDCDDIGESPIDDPFDCNDNDPTLHALRLAKIDDDFSTVENSDTSTWSYRYTTSLASSDYDLLPIVNQPYLKDTWDPGPQPRLWAVSSNQTPWLGRNDTGGDQILNDKAIPVSLLWRSGAVAMAPGRTQKVVLAWRAEVDGTAAVTATFADMAVDNDGINWSIEYDGEALDSGEIDASGGVGTSGERFIDNFPVSAGDFIYFVIDPVGPGPDVCDDGDPSCNDATELEATVSLCSVN